MLQAVARRLTACLREADIVSRLGGDEFVVVLDGAPTAADAERVVGKIERALSSPLEVAGRTVVARASIGVVMSLAGETPDSLLARADAAMYRVKRQRRDGPRRADPSAHDPTAAPHGDAASS